MANKNSFKMGQSLTVWDYYEDSGDYKDDKEAAFDLASDDAAAAAKGARADLKGGGLSPADAKKLTFTARFVEFDSGNPTHAGAYYEVEVRGKREDVVARARAIYKKITGDDEPEQLDLI